MKIKGKTAIIAGGASGLGAATTRELAARGARVAILDLNESQGTKMASELGETVTFFKIDVTDPEALDQVLSKIASRWKELHIALNCAGTILGEKILGKEKQPHDLERFRKVIEVNLIGSFNLLRLAAGVMSRNHPDGESQERGIIINTSSVAAFEGQIGQTAYAASKAGIAGLTLPAARELADLGIRVCSIAPGVFDTAMLSKVPEKVRRALSEQPPFPRRLGNPREFALLACSIVENPMLNGTVIRLDGALRMPPR